MNCKCGNNFGSRQRSGPTSSKKHFMILVDRCSRCDQLHPVYPDRLSYQEQDWITRWNRNVYQEYLKEQQKEPEYVLMYCDVNSTLPCSILDPNDTSGWYLT